MLRTDIINHFISKYNLQSYLEIGTYKKENFSKINCTKKSCVDPDPKTEPDFLMTSDNFFEQNIEKFDIIFIDGLHEAHQAYRDIQHSLACLNPKGIIICHDCNPMQPELTVGPEDFTDGMNWTGDVWKGFVRYRYESPYKCYVIDEDWGCGVINTNLQTDIEMPIKLDINEMTWAVLDNNREQLLGLTKGVD